MQHFLRLSRACLGKKIVFSSAMKRHRKSVFFAAPVCQPLRDLAEPVVQKIDHDTCGENVVDLFLSACPMFVPSLPATERTVFAYRCRHQPSIPRLARAAPQPAAAAQLSSRQSRRPPAAKTNGTHWPQRWPQHWPQLKKRSTTLASTLASTFRVSVPSLS